MLRKLNCGAIKSNLNVWGPPRDFLSGWSYRLTESRCRTAVDRGWSSACEAGAMPVPAGYLSEFPAAAFASSASLIPLPPINTHQPGVVTSLLYSGSKFRGHQKSKGNSYDVEVVLQVGGTEAEMLLFVLRARGFRVMCQSGGWKSDSWKKKGDPACPGPTVGVVVGVAEQLRPNNTD